MRFIYKNEMFRFLNVIKLGTIQQLRGQEEGGRAESNKERAES